MLNMNHCNRGLGSLVRGIAVIALHCMPLYRGAYGLVRVVCPWNVELGMGTGIPGCSFIVSVGGHLKSAPEHDRDRDRPGVLGWGASRTPASEPTGFW